MGRMLVRDWDFLKVFRGLLVLCGIGTVRGGGVPLCFVGPPPLPARPLPGACGCVAFGASCLLPLGGGGVWASARVLCPSLRYSLGWLIY